MFNRRKKLAIKPATWGWKSAGTMNRKKWLTASLIVGEPTMLQNQHDGQFSHIGHERIARRVTLSRLAALAENQKQVPYARQPASPRGTLRPIVTKREAGCDGRGRRARTKRGRCVRRSRVVPTPRCWCQASKMIAGDGD